MGIKTPEPRAMRYAAILDAGSSGTRIYMYGWKSWREGDPSPPQIEELLSWKIGPGIAEFVTQNNNTFDARVQARVERYLDSLFICGRSFCAGAGISSTSVPLFFLATAGMRDLRDAHLQAYSLLLVCIKTFTKDRSGFDAKECGAITGEAEALYGWIAANYSLGSFSGYGLRASQTVGYVELGGASAQIAYKLVLNEDTAVARAAKAAEEEAGRAAKVAYEQDRDAGEYGDLKEESDEEEDNEDYAERAKKVKRARDTLAEDDISGGLDNYAGRLVKIKIGALEFDLFLGSYPMGVNVARKRFGEKLTGNNDTINDPSKHDGWQEKIGGTTYKGTANLEDVENIIRRLDLFKPLEKPNKKVVQSLNRSFVGGASFWYNTREVFGTDEDGAPKTTPFSFNEYDEEVKLSLELSWTLATERRSKIKQKFLEESGFTAAWIRHVLFDCFGFKRHDTIVTHEDKLTFRPYNGSNGAEHSWTLGRIVLYSLDGVEPWQMSGPLVRDYNRLNACVKKERGEILKLKDKISNMKHLLAQHQKSGNADGEDEVKNCIQKLDAVIKSRETARDEAIGGMKKVFEYVKGEPQDFFEDLAIDP